jgi:DegV family protein with EDD domain
MAGVRIVTDSSSDLSDEQVAEFGIEIVPLTIRFGDEEFVDRQGLSVAEFYRRLGESSALPETAAPSPGSFEQAFRKLAAEGADAVVCVTISSGLSATMQSAQTGAAALDGAVDVRVVDSRSVSLGLGTQAMLAARAAREGADVDAVEAVAKDLASRTHVYGALDTLEYLKKGGRIGNAQHLLGTVLSIKPLIDLSSGVTEEAGKARTRKKALAWLADKILSTPDLENLCVIHGQATDLDEFLALLAPRYSRDDITIGLIGAVIGTHGGPAIMGISFQTPAPAG